MPFAAVPKAWSCDGGAQRKPMSSPFSIAAAPVIPESSGASVSGRAGICCLSASRFSRTMVCAAARCSGVNCVMVIRSSLSIVMSYYTISARRSSSPTSIKIKISPIFKVWGEGGGAGGDCRILGNYFHFHSIIHNNSSLPIWHEPRKLFISAIKWKRFPDLRQPLFCCDFREFVI